MSARQTPPAPVGAPPPGSGDGQGGAAAKKNIVQFGSFQFAADPIYTAPDAPTPGQLVGYRLTGPRRAKHIIAIDPATGQPDAHALASLKLWIDACNYRPGASRKAVRQ